MTARYTDWTHTRVVGSREAAAAYVPHARKLLGQVMQEAESMGLGVHQIRTELEDGAVIVAEKHGSIPRITITPPPGGARKRPMRVFEDLVTSNGLAQFSEDTRDRPPIILSPSRDAVWSSFFFGKTSPGYNASTANSKGTYKDVFPTTEDDASVLSDASRSWRSPAGEYVSWLTVFDYFVPAYRHPASLYAGAVVRAGRVVFNTNTYGGPNGEPLDEVRVLAAAFKGDWLYVMLAELGELTYTARPATPSFMHDAWASQPYSSASAPYRLARFKMRSITDPATNVLRFEVKNGTMETLWAGSLERAYAGWSFNEAMTECVSYQIPANTLVLYKAGAVDAAQSASTLRLAFAINIAPDEASATYGTTSAGDKIAEENGTTLRLVKVGPHAYDYVCGDSTFVAYRWDGVGKIETGRQLAYANLRTKSFVFYEYVYSYAEPPDLTVAQFAAIAVHDNQETEFHTDSRSFTASVEQQFVLTTFRDYMNTSGGCALALMYTKAGGVVLTTVDPLDLEDEPAGGFIYATAWCRMLSLSLRPEEFGLSNGGVSFTIDNDESATSWAWDATTGYGPGGAITPSYNAELPVVFVSIGAAAADSFLFFSSSYKLEAASGIANFITSADDINVADLTGGGTITDERVVIAYILGKPAALQAREIAA